MKKSIFIAAILVPACSQAALYNYVEFFQMHTGIPGSMTGQMKYDTFGNYINVSYSGNVVIDSQINNQGSYYYTGFGTGPSPYTNSLVSNAPTRTDIVALAGQTTGVITNTITFSQPVIDPIMDIVSLGSSSQVSNYDFNTPFTILSTGPGHFGSGTLTNPFGNRLSGMEGDGVIQFKGKFTSISFTASPNEYWGGFNVGAQPVPEPASIAAVGMGLLAFARRKKGR